MNRPAIGALAAILMMASVAQPSDSGPTRAALRIKAIADAADSMRDRLVSVRRDIHMHPELSNREARTGALVAARLKELGIEVRENVAGHGVVGILKGGRPGPVVALRADMDALPIQETNDVSYKSTVPNVKHACGHDAHTTIGLGVAELLAGMRANIPGTVKFIFQPAEEGAPEGEEGGAALMIKQGALEDPAPDALFGLHVYPAYQVGTIAYKSGATMASADKFTIVIRGKASHGAAPQEGIDAIVVAAQCVEALQTIESRRIKATDPVVLSVGVIRGGVRHNIIASEVTMEGTLRTLDEDVRANIKRMMREVLTGITSASGASFTLDFKESAAVTFNDPQLVTDSVPSLESAVGADHVVACPWVMVSEDFSYYQRKVPGFFYFLGVSNPAKGITASWHTAEFDLDEDALVIGVKAMSNLVLDYLERRAGS